ncbi:MAG: heat-inducible transcriptional repressor HrcA [Lachnospiraceae bacterium]|nr:heat-inducible transcriptional repressor HrcA [Lachnospiraceae bacterium]
MAGQENKNKTDGLDDRKLRILHAVIRNYLETGEPVGSRTISKYTDLNLSSATIRNEMSDLEEMGYIVQPHTSAGRIPTDKAYRLYVDTMMEEKEREISDLKELLSEAEEKMDLMLKKVARVLAVNTNYATVVTAPAIHGNKLKFIQLSRVDDVQLLATIVVEGNVIRNSMIPVDEVINEETLLKLNILLNTHLNGMSLDEINLGMITLLKEQAGIHAGIVGDILDAVAQAIRGDEDLEVYTSGATNILKYPELADNQKAGELINTFEEKKALAKIAEESLDDGSTGGIQVYIGEESPIDSMKDCSVVTATYELGDGMRGSIAIVGPKRMDYDKVVGTLKTMKDELENTYKKKGGGGKKKGSAGKKE